MSDLAGVGRRLKASAIDVAAVVALLCACMALISWLDRWLNQGWVVFIFVAVSVLLPPGYLLMEVRSGQTPGKRLTGLRVGHRDGGPASKGSLWSRWALKSSPVFVGTAFMLFRILVDEPLFYDLMRPLMQAAEAAGRRMHSDAVQGMLVTPVVYAAGIPLALLLMAGWLLVLAPSRRALHDRLTGTSVYFAAAIDGASPAFEPLTRAA